MTRAKRTNPRERKREILQAAMQVAAQVGHKQITREAVAFAARVSGPLVAKYYRNMIQLKRAVFREALRIEFMPVLKHCVADEALDKFPEIKRNILAYIHKTI